MQSLLHERKQPLMIKRFWKKGEVPPSDAVSCQVMIDIAGHEDDSQIFPYAERTDGKLVAVHVRKLIGAGGQLKAWRGKDEVCEQQIDGSFVLRADFEGV